MDEARIKTNIITQQTKEDNEKEDFYPGSCRHDDGWHGERLSCLSVGRELNAMTEWP